MDTVWALAGSSICVLVGFLIPCASYIQISRRCGNYSNGGGYKSNLYTHAKKRALLAKGLIVIYTIIMVLCSWHALVTTI